jgi:choline-sulfatase
MGDKFSRSDEPIEGPDDATLRGTAASTTRRELLRGGAGLAASLSGVSAALTTPAIARDPISLPKAPNIIVLMTDQERHHMHWPAGWAEKTCPGCNG